MDPIITPDLVAKRLIRTFTQGQEEAVAIVAAGVQAELESHLGRYLSVRAVAGETHVLAPSQQRVFLRGSPVVAVSAFTIDGVAQAAQNYAVHAWGVEIFGVFSQFLAPPVAAFDYTAGLDASDEAAYPGLKSLLLRATLRETQKALQGIDGIKFVQMTGFSASLEELFLAEELKRVSRYRRRKGRGSGTAAASHAGGIGG